MLAQIRNSYHFIILLILCGVFICIKLPNLNVPLFWDESWVYGPAIRAMAHSGISLLPSGLSDSLSRGHPLLFFCVGAMWVKLFGGSLFSLHLFALAIAISFILVLFYVVKKLFDPTLALIVAALMLVQPNFISQAGIAVPEIFLALWAILGIYHYVVGNRYYYFLFGTLVLLTKESGAVIIAALMLYDMICFFTKKVTLNSFKSFIGSSLIAFSPIFSFIVFLIIQHHQRGYYFFPEHIGFIDLNWVDLQEKIKHCYNIVFEEQGRVFITWSFLIAFALLYRLIPLTIRLIVVIGAMISVKIFFRFWALPDRLMVPLTGLIILAFYYFVHVKYADKLKNNEKFLAILFITGLLYIIFSAINFFTNRYLLILIPMMVLYFSFYIKKSLEFRPFLPYLWAVLIGAVTIYMDAKYSMATGDDSPKYIEAIRLEQTMVNYLEQQRLQKSNIYCKFTMCIALKDTACGFLSQGGDAFTGVKDEFTNNSEYVIYTNVDYDKLWQNGCDTLPDFRMVKKFDYGVAHGRIFKRIENGKE